MDRVFTFTFWPSAFAGRKVGTKKDRSWSEWVEFFQTFEERGFKPAPDAKKNPHKGGLCYVPGVVNGTRASIYLEEIHAIACDIDSGTDEQIAEGLLNLKPFEYVAHSSYSHGLTSQTKIRIIVPLSRPISPEAFPANRARINKLLGGLLDKQTSDAIHLYYTPRTWIGNEDRIAIHNPGEFFEPVEYSTPEKSETDFGSVVTSLPKLWRIQEWLEKQSRKRDGNGRFFRKLLAGEALAEAGEGRREALRSLTMRLAYRTSNEPLSFDQLAGFFQPSIDAMNAADPDDPTKSIEEVFAMYSDAVTKVKAERKEEKENRTGASEYTAEEVSEILDRYGPDVRWILYNDKACFFLTPDGYTDEHPRTLADTSVFKALARVPDSYVQLYTYTEKGFVPKSLREILIQYGTPIRKIVPTWVKNESELDHLRMVFYDAIRPILPDLEPRHNPKIEKWIRLLGGRNEEKLLDWLACAPDLSRLLCAIYFHGVRRAGKSLFAKGLSRLWGNEPISQSEFFASNFNDSLQRSPIVVAEEHLTKVHNIDPTMRIRDEVAKLSRPLHRKGLAPVDIEGAIRIIVTANNKGLIKSSRLSLDDIEATAERILFVDCSQAAADYLQAIPKDEVLEWGDKGIAEFALWLQENRKVPLVNRFFVEGNYDDSVISLLFANEWASRVCQYLASYLEDPSLLMGSTTVPKVCTRGGRLYANASGILKNWVSYIPQEPRDLELAPIANALNVISHPGHLTLPWEGRGSKTKYREVDTRTIFAWADENGFDTETMRKNLTIDTEGLVREGNVTFLGKRKNK